MTAITRKPHAGGHGASGAQHRKGIEATTAFYAAARQPYSDPRGEFLDAMHRAGIVPSDLSQIVADGRLCRFHVDGDKRHTKNGWRVLFVDGGRAAGVFGSWKLGTTHKWHAGGERLSRAEQARMDAAIAQARAQREQEQRQRHADAQTRAAKLWAQSMPADPQHGYLQRKRVQPHGIRQLGELLVVPLRDGDGVLWSLEFVAADGVKRFLSGGRKRGCYFPIGRVSDKLLVAEGFATAASLHEATGYAVAVAFDAGNLQPVARVLRAKFPHAQITICADNDTGTPGNPGLTKATAAAAAVGGRVAVPPAGQDFNDVAVAEVHS